MPVKLDTPAAQVDTSADEFKTMLGNLQANILKPHGRDHARHVFLRFTAPRDAVRAWIRSTVQPLVTTAQQEFSTPRGVDGGLVGGFFLSAKGYEFLGFNPKSFASGVFRKGMKHRGGGLFDSILDTGNKDPEPKTWEAGFQQEIHALVTLADDDPARVSAAAGTLAAGAASVASVLCVEAGNTLRRKNPKTGRNDPVEHFGYFDGISQPVFIKKDHDRVADRQQWDPDARLSLVLVDDPFTSDVDAFGSYLVYRKLGQDVARFDQAVSALAAAMGVGAELAGAMVVGRFKDGTPVVRDKVPGMADFNDFNFREDVGAWKCPYHAHIRKTNPRGTTPATSLESERRRRIARRGIPYGAPVSADVADNMAPNSDPNAPRGLLFLCFQSNVGDQFEFIQRTWVDNEHFPSSALTLGLIEKDPGDDPLIGQDRGESQHWPKEWGNREAKKKKLNFEGAVTLKGGEYFFAPSLPFIRSL